jgi:hypothetical protein
LVTRYKHPREAQSLRTQCRCDACQGDSFRLHIGDRIVFSGGLPGRLMHELKYLGENAGLRVQGNVGPESKLIVTNDSEDNSSTVQKAIAGGIRTASPDQFKIQISKMQENGRYIHEIKKQNFDELYLFAQKVYPVGLSEVEIQKLNQVISKNGGSLGQQLRPSLVAGIYNNESKLSGQIKILESEGIPVFHIDEI